MSTVHRPRSSTTPSLVAGQGLDQPTFHARYAAMPPETRAELVGGAVYMPSPVSFDHSQEGLRVSGWIFHYLRQSPGVHGGIDATVKLDMAGEVQPDFQAAHLLDGSGMAGERAGDQVDQAGLADTGGTGHQQSQRLIRVRTQAFCFPQQHFRHFARLPHEIRRTGRDKAGGRGRWREGRMNWAI